MWPPCASRVREAETSPSDPVSLHSGRDDSRPAPCCLSRFHLKLEKAEEPKPCGVDKGQTVRGGLLPKDYKAPWVYKGKRDSSNVERLSLEPVLFPPGYWDDLLKQAKQNLGTLVPEGSNCRSTTE